ncbi:hypothetical protein JTB14_010967 [Gonioctena quinquepunctata]|nr:hypothetical protein JTB14_010967 [Gonioctena quinquepunctata]
MADVTVLEGQDIPVTKNTLGKLEFNLQHMLRTHNQESPRRGEVQTVSAAGLQRTGGNKKAGKKQTIGQQEIPPAEEPTSSSHPTETTSTTEPPEDFGKPEPRKLLIRGRQRHPELRQLPGWKTTLPNRERTANLVEEPTRLQMAREGPHEATVQFQSTHGYGRAEPRTGRVLVLSNTVDHVVWFRDQVAFVLHGNSCNVDIS